MKKPFAVSFFVAIYILIMSFIIVYGAYGQEKQSMLVTSPIETERVTRLPNGNYEIQWFGRRQLISQYQATPHKEYYWEIQYDAATGKILCLHIPEVLGG